MLRLITRILTLTLLSGSLAAATLDNTEAEEVITLEKLSSVEQLSSADLREIAFVVQSHIWALTRNKAEIAFELTAPASRKDFASAPDYMKHLRSKHKPLAYAKTLALDTVSFSEGSPIQHAYVTDVLNKTWRVSFRLLHNDLDGTWRVTSVAMIPAPGLPV